MSKETIYNGSRPCAGCGTPITPLQAMYGDSCPRCTAEKVRTLVQNRMVRE